MGGRSSRVQPVDLNKVKRYSIYGRANKTTLKGFAKPLNKLSGVPFFESLPDFLKASDLNEFVALTVKARRAGRPFHLLLGAHLIKVGLSPIIIDLMQRKIVTSISFNCAGLIHDLELACFGGTSEDVQAGLLDGSFGMVKQTAEIFEKMCLLADRKTIGLGEAGGEYLNHIRGKFLKHSLFAVAHKLGIPALVHIGIGTDIVSQHPGFNASLAGAASHIDFRILAAICRSLDRGGVAANIGSAVILPEVFLKALTVARNLGTGRSRLTTANFDMIVHYRPSENIVNRPTFKAGKGFNFVGHHEIMIPLLAWGLKARMRRK